MRNLYWVREMEALDDSEELAPLQAARDRRPEGLWRVMRSREIGVPSFVIAGLLIPLAASIWRIGSGFTFAASGWRCSRVLAGVRGRGRALVDRAARHRDGQPAHHGSPSSRATRRAVGVGRSCGQPPRDRSRTFAAVAITLMVGVWIVLPTLVAIAIAT